MKGFLLVLSVMIFAFKSDAQYRYVKLKLRVSSFVKENNYEISLFMKNDTSYAQVKQYSTSVDTIYFNDDGDEEVNKYNTLFDKIYVINGADFNKVCSMAMSLSLSDILNGTNYSNPSIYTHPVGCYLTIDIMQEQFIYSVVNPKINTKNRNLEDYYLLCYDILKLAKLRPDKLLH